MGDPALDLILEDSDREGIYTIVAQVTNLVAGKNADNSYTIRFIKDGLYQVVRVGRSTSLRSPTTLTLRMTGVAALPSSRSHQGTVNYGRFPDLHRIYLSNLLG